MERTKQEEQAYENRILQNSIERVINTTIQVVTDYDPKLVPAYQGAKNKHKLEHWEELRDINLQDWEELKQATVRLWNEERDRIFRRRNNMPPKGQIDTTENPK